MSHTDTASCPVHKHNYTLMNKRDGRLLKHPLVGLWFTPNKSEAEEMLVACHEYLNAIGAGDLAAEFVIVDAESGQELE